MDVAFVLSAIADVMALGEHALYFGISPPLPDDSPQRRGAQLGQPFMHIARATFVSLVESE
jgi:hypothetical protein